MQELCVGGNPDSLGASDPHAVGRGGLWEDEERQLSPCEDGPNAAEDASSDWGEDNDAGTGPPLRQTLRAVEEAEYNVLLRALLATASRRRVRQVCSDLILAFSCDNMDCGEPLLFHMPRHNDGAEVEEEEEGSTGEGGNKAQMRTVLLPTVRRITINAYLGAKQLNLLADVLSGAAPSHLPTHDGGAAPADSAPFSLFPSLEELSLCGLVARFDAPGSQHNVFGESCVAYRALFEALRGHPSLRKLDLSGSSVGPLLLPSLRRLVRCTPSLCDVDLSHTLLDEDEQEGIRALCLVNAMRLQQCHAPRSTGATATTATPPTAPLSVRPAERSDRSMAGAGEQHKWLEAKVLQIMSSDLSDSADPEDHPPSSVSPYIARNCSERDVDELLSVLYGRQPTRASRSHLAKYNDYAGRKGRSNGGASGITSSVGGNGNDDVASVGSDAERCSEEDDAEEEGEWDEEEDTEVSRANPTLTLPFLHYRLPADDPYVLSRQCVEVVKSAFRHREEATRTFLGGRPVAPGIPGPLAQLLPSSAAAHLSANEREALKRSMSRSALLTALRGTLFPQPHRPPSVFGPQCSNTDLHTTAEENYYATLATQEQQWDLILDRLLSHARPAFLCPNATTQEASVYDAGCSPYWLYFLPPSPWGTRVELRYPQDSASSTPAVLQVEQGQFFGEVDLLGGWACYTNASSALEGNMATRKLLGRKLKTTTILQQLQKMRHASAVLSIARDTRAAASATGKGGPLAESSPTPSLSAQPSPLVWQLPMEVAFFFLNEPYQRLHTQLAPSLLLLRNGHEQALPAALCPTMACLMESHLVTRRGTLSGLDGDGGPSNTKASNVVAEKDDLPGNIYFLQAGEYTLCTFTRQGKWLERPLLPGNVLIGKQAFAMDAAAREAAGLACRTSTAAAVAAAAGTAVGKDAALRQFREAKRRARLATAAADTAARAPESAAAREVAAPEDTGEGEQMLCLGRVGSSPASGEWRYFTISTARFACLPECTRVALTANAVVLPPLE